MLTAKENMRQAITGGTPDRFVNQYEAIRLLFYPWMLHSSPALPKGGPDVVNAWGVTNSWPDYVPGPFPVHTPDKIVVKDIENWRDYVKAPPLKFPDSEWEMFQKQWDEVDGDKAFKAAFIAPGLFEQTHHLCSMVNALVYYMEDDDEMHEMLKYLLDWEIELADGIISHLHPEMIFHHDDWGSENSTFFRPEMWADFFLEPYKTLYGFYHENGVEFVVHHSDSYCATLVPYMIEMGMDVWQGVMRTNHVEELIPKYADKITFMGNIDNKQVDFDGWTTEDCKKAALLALDGFSPKGYIPCITQGGPGSVYPGTYAELTKYIDQYNAEKFGFTVEEIEAQRMPLQIMF